MSADAPTMEAIALRHESALLRETPDASFQWLQPIKREPWGDRPADATIFRVGKIHAGYKGPEYSIYIDHPKGALVLVLLCPEGRDNLYVPALRWVAQKTLMLDCTYGAAAPAPEGPGYAGV